MKEYMIEFCNFIPGQKLENRKQKTKYDKQNSFNFCGGKEKRVEGIKRRTFYRAKPSALFIF